MRTVSVIGLFVAFAPKIATAGHRHDAPEVRDHRSSSSSSSDDGPKVRDHRSHDSSDDGPKVRDHRSHDSDDSPKVRDHRGSSDGCCASDAPIYVADDPVYVSDGGGPSPGFSSYTGPTWRLELGGIARRFRGPSFNRSGTVETTWGDTANYDLASGTPTAGDTAGGAFAMRFIVPTSEHLYMGGEVELGGLTRTPIQMMTDNSDIHISSRSLIGTGLVLGAKAQHGIAELDAEVAGGLRIQSITMQSRDAMEDDPSETESALTGVVEARVRGALWIAPHVYLAAQVGTSVLDRSDVNLGFSIGIASRAYGAMR
jgi:hypothetical protein